MTTTTKLVDEHGTEVELSRYEGDYVYVNHQGAMDTSVGVLMHVDHEDDTYTYEFLSTDVFVVEDRPAPSALIVAFRGVITGRTYCHDCAHAMQVAAPSMQERILRHGQEFAERLFHASAVEVVLLHGEDALVTPMIEASGRCSACGLEI